MRCRGRAGRCAQADLGEMHRPKKVVANHMIFDVELAWTSRVSARVSEHARGRALPTSSFLVI